GPGARSTRRGERARRREPRLNGAGGGRRAALPSPRGGARVRVGAARSEWRAGDGPVPARSVLLRAGRGRGPGSGRPRAGGVVPPLAAGARQLAARARLGSGARRRGDRAAAGWQPRLLLVVLRLPTRGTGLARGCAGTVPGPRRCAADNGSGGRRPAGGVAG